MGVILTSESRKFQRLCTPHTHGGDSSGIAWSSVTPSVLPILMGVILGEELPLKVGESTPHTHGGDSMITYINDGFAKYSP